MPTYPYSCDDCEVLFKVKKPADLVRRPEPCPECGSKIAEQNFLAKTIRGYVSKEGNWSGGKFVPQLHPNHPDRMVTSKKQMEEVYRKHGICLESGRFTSREAQIRATVPKNGRTKNWRRSNTTLGGLREDVDA